MAPKRRIVVYVAPSADRFIARKDGSVDWLERPRPKGNYGWNGFYRSIDTCLLGRKTYDVSVRHGMPEPGVERTTTSFHECSSRPRVPTSWLSTKT